MKQFNIHVIRVLKKKNRWVEELHVEIMTEEPYAAAPGTMTAPAVARAATAHNHQRSSHHPATAKEQLPPTME